MSDPHGHGGGEGGINISPMGLAIGLAFLIVFSIYFYLNPNHAKSFIFVLNIIQVICVGVLLFMLHKLWYFMNEFFKNGSAIVQNYESKLKHHHEHIDDKANLKSKYNLAMQYIHSRNENEWKIGLVELDNFIRLGLLDKGYIGATTIELVKNAAEKGHEGIKAADDVAHLRQRLKLKGSQFDFTQEDLNLVLKNFDKFKKTILLDDGHEHHDDHHGH